MAMEGQSEMFVICRYTWGGVGKQMWNIYLSSMDMFEMVLEEGTEMFIPI